jgi:hypothetical protein
LRAYESEVPLALLLNHLFSYAGVSFLISMYAW